MQIGKEIATIREALDVMAGAHPAKPFLIGAESGKQLSFLDVQQETTRLSLMLRAAGLERGDKVAFLMDNGLLTVQLFLGTMYGGLVAVPLNVRAGAMQLSYMLDHCDAKIVFVAEQYASLLSEALTEVHRDIRVITASAEGPLPAFEPISSAAWASCPAADDVALLMYSSGSTGKPKGAMHTHGTVLAHGRNSIASHQLTAEDRSLLVLPLYHINAECVTLVPTLLSAGSIVVAHRFVVSKFWDWIDGLAVTWSALVPTIIGELVEWNDPGKNRRKAAFKRIRFFRSSSAPLSLALHQQFLDKFKLPLLQAMGSTECGNVFSNPQPPAKNKIGSPGQVWGFLARLVDRQGVEVPDGEAGEILLRGPGLMKGYYKDPDGTAAVLDKDGWFHTGDLARRDEDGYFFIVGRSKELIVKGGVNIAPRQIDEVLELHPSVMEAAAVGVPDRYFGEDVVAFAVLRSGAVAEENELLAFCESRLGHFKTPSRIHFLKQLPKGPSGKVQRLKLLDPAALAAAARTSAAGGEPAKVTEPILENGNDSLPSLSKIEQIIASVWAEVLSVPKVDLHTNFFALNGHSLLAIQCLSKLRRKLPVLLTINDFFEKTTVFEQAELVRERMHPGKRAGDLNTDLSPEKWEQSVLDEFVPSVSGEAIPRRDSSLPYPLSPAQQRLWFMEQLNPGVPVYNEAEAVRLAGELNVDALETALNMIVARHELPRSTVKVIQGVPHAVVHEQWPLRFEKIDLSLLAAAEREKEVGRMLTELPRAPYNLEAEPGIRVALLRLAEREHVLILMVHHIICDWYSQGILWRELAANYCALINGEPAALPTLPLLYGDYAAWQQQRTARMDFAADLDFWEEMLQGAPGLLEVPADRVRPAVMSYKGGRLRWKLDGSVTEKLRRTSQQEKVSLFTIFAAALNTLLYRYTGSEDILIGVPLADRDQQELQSMIGFLLHTHVLRTHLTAATTFRELLSSVQKGALELYAHRSAPFDQVVRKLGQERDAGYTPLFQVMLNWRDRDQQLSFIGLDGLTVESLMSHSNSAKFDLQFFAADGGEEIWMEMEYSADLFDEDRMRRMLGHLQCVLESAAVDPGQPISALKILPEVERQQVLYKWNDTRAQYPSATFVHRLIEKQAQRTPNALALVFEDDRMSYEVLNSRANQLAHHLRKLGVRPDSRVAVSVERSFEMVIALLAIHKAGGAYVPLDPSYPSERLDFMLRNSEPVAILTQSQFKHVFSDWDCDGESGGTLPVLDLSHSGPWAGGPDTDPDPEDIGLTPQHLAYVLYISSSTGQPKGVMVQHQGVCNRLDWGQRTYPMRASDAILQKTPFSVDVSVEEFFPPLLAGARLVIARPEGHKDPAYLVELIQRNKVTVAHFVPSMLQAFLDNSAAQTCTTLTRVVCSGEALPAALAKRFQQALPQVELVNLYGPTEATVEATAWQCPPDVQQSTVPIGKPIANTRTYILDAQLEPVPVGVPGELFIAGVQVARGYLNRPELTAEKFLADPFTSGPEARMYRTGDLCRWLPDGNIEYLGRNDSQVKLGGYRIELGEIENELLQNPWIRQCVVTVQGKDPADQKLVAYFVPAEPNHVPSVESLRQILQLRLPAYMVPSSFAVIDEIPLTPSGKTDIKKLMHSEVKAAQHESPLVAPRDPVEAELVRIWESTLGVRPIGIHSNFFDVGGYSLLIVKLFAQINKAFNRQLPVAIIFRFPIIEQLATHIRGKSIDSCALVPIRAKGSKPPLFIVHSYLTYERFRQVLDEDRPLYGLHESEDEDERLSSVQERVKEYARLIREKQPEGPYYLIAWSASGPMAIEIARSLEEHGGKIAMLGLIDAVHPRYLTEIRQRRAQIPRTHRYRSWMEHHLERRKRFPNQGKLRYFAGEIRDVLINKARHTALRYCQPLVRLFGRSGSSLPRFVDHLAAVRIENLEPYNGKITLFRPLDNNRDYDDPALGWREIASGGVDLVWTPGNSESMFLEGNVEKFGQLVEGLLDKRRNGKAAQSCASLFDAVSS